MLRCWVWSPGKELGGAPCLPGVHSLRKSGYKTQADVIFTSTFFRKGKILWISFSWRTLM